MKKLSIISAVALMLLSACGQNGQVEDKQLLQIGDDIAIAQTEYGKVQGFIYKDVYTFLGIPYGAPTSGANRFMPPQAPEKWDGIKPALFYGNVAPQNVAGKYTNSYGTFVDHWNYYDVSENCLSLNVWTPGLDGAKRPVLVWFHGGGYTSGNGIEQDGYNGNNLSHDGNVVFISVNHRLGPMGFSDLSALGEKYASSGNVGVLDLVAALKWVNKNIAAFGGDPGNVTIMGQSGGGAKVSTVLAMESAKGLVHKAVCLSGNGTRAMNQEVSRGIGEYILKEAGLKPGQADKLQQMPWEEYYALANRASAKYAADHPGIGRAGFSPVEDGVIIPKDGYFQPDGHAKNIPVLYCCTFAERSISRDSAELEAMDKAGAIQYLKASYGDKAEAIIAECEKAFPDMKPIEWVDLVAWAMRPGVINSANAKVAQGGAPVWTAWFGYKANIFDGRLRAFHCSDICYWFRNTDLMYTHTGGGPEPRALSNKMSAALLSFMRTGNPNCKEIPEWPQYTPDEGAVMILDKTCEVKYDPDKAIRALM